MKTNIIRSNFSKFMRNDWYARMQAKKGLIYVCGHALTADEYLSVNHDRKIVESARSPEDLYGSIFENSWGHLIPLYDSLSQRGKTLLRTYICAGTVYGELSMNCNQKEAPDSLTTKEALKYAQYFNWGNWRFPNDGVLLSVSMSNRYWNIPEVEWEKKVNIIVPFNEFLNLIREERGF